METDTHRRLPDVRAAGVLSLGFAVWLMAGVTARGAASTYGSTASTNFGAGPTYAVTNCLVAGAWYNVSGTTTFKTNASPPAGYGLSFPAAGGGVPDTARIGKMDLTAVGILDSPNNSQAQITLDYTTPVTANLNMNFAAGASGRVHVIWGSYTANSPGGATLTVTDQTWGVTFNYTAYPDLSFEIAYNGSYVSRHSTFNVTDCKAMNINVTETNIWNQAWPA